MDFVSQPATFTTHSPAETQALAERLAGRLLAGDVLWLSGDLGAGKTTFAQGLGRGLRVSAPVVSPTFVLVREYRGRLPLYHIDLYRLDERRDMLNLGLRDYLDGDGVCVVEWAERFDAEHMLPGLHIHFEPLAENVRALTFRGIGERAARLQLDLSDGGRGT
jgi:tRNA threonylcarbamoyladenosine biosynthesis protein TsaE